MIKKLCVVVILGSIFFLVSNKGVDIIQKYIDSHQTAKWAPASQFKLAELCFFTMRYEKSLTLYETLRTRYPSHQNADEALFRIARCYENLNDIESALEKYKEFIYLYPNHQWKAKANNAITSITLLK